METIPNSRKEESLDCGCTVICEDVEHEGRIAPRLDVIPCEEHRTDHLPLGHQGFPDHVKLGIRHLMRKMMGNPARINELPH